MMYCADCIHYIHADEPFCDIRPAGNNYAGYLNTACNKFQEGDSRKERAEYLAQFENIKFKTQQEKHMEEVINNQAKQETKVCKKCGRTLPVSEFGRHSKSKDGLQPFCRECRSAQISEARRAALEARKQAAPDDLDYHPSPVDTMTDAELADALRRRGYDVKATKTIEI